MMGAGNRYRHPTVFTTLTDPRSEYYNRDGSLKTVKDWMNRVYKIYPSSR